MRERTLPTIITTLVPGYFIFFLLTKGLDYLQNDLIFGLISAISIFILPALISKVILKKKYFGIGYIISTLIYPIFYLISYFLHSQYSIDSTLSYNIFALIILFATVYLTIFITYTSNIYVAKKISKTIIVILIVTGTILAINHFLGLNNNSLLSLDFLQHNTISMQIAEGKLCLTPNDCSSLFKKLGYTSYFHTIQAVLTIGFGIETGLAANVFNIGFIIISILTIYSLFQKHLKDDEQAFLGASASILFFQLGAYSFNFTIPQTFVLLLFINLLTEGNLTFKKLFLSLPILLATHFIFGPFFIAITSIYLIFFKEENKNLNLSKTLTILSFIAIFLTFIANYRGFSIEKLLQYTDTEQLGFYTNYYFPENLQFLATQYGFVLIPLFIAMLYFLFKKKTSNINLFAITYISISLSCYFLAPTYANKFLIGSCIFILFLITSLISDLNFRKLSRFVILLALLLSLIPFYLLNYSEYNIFYTQNNGTISGIVKEDEGLINYLNLQNLECQIVSDPYTQISITGQTAYDSAGGQYQELSTRQSFVNFIYDPIEENYTNLLESTDISSGRICLIVSSRTYSRNNYPNENNISWLTSMYEYEINNNFEIGETFELTNLLLRKGYTLEYSDQYNLLFIQ